MYRALARIMEGNLLFLVVIFIPALGELNFFCVAKCLDGRLRRLLGAAQGGRLSDSLLREVASLMREPVEHVGSCGSGCCVEIDGTASLLNLHQSVSPASDTCSVYTCTVRERADM